MSNTNPVFRFFQKHFGTELNASQKDAVLEVYKQEFFKKKEILFRQGEINTRHYIIEKGLLRLYLVDPKGKEINILFAKENQVIGDLSTPDPTSFNLETTEDSVVYSIDDASLRQLIIQIDPEKSFEPGDGIRKSYIHIQNRLVSILSKSAEENYLEFQNRYPDLVQRLPQYHIASYLGISAEFLSKIIARNAKKK